MSTFAGMSQPMEGACLDLLQRFEVAPDALIDARALQQRVERKYVLPERHLTPLLTGLLPDCCVVWAGHQVWARYESEYFDTPDRALYHAHRRDVRPRHKIRVRRHVDRNLSFLEIKRKEKNGRTVKLRLTVPGDQASLGARERDFIEAHTPLGAAHLVPSLSVAFLRLTLVGRVANERLTLDQKLRVTAAGRSERISGAVIAEIKQDRNAHHGPASATLRTLRAREIAVSKYCLGTMLVAAVPSNVFRPALRLMERLSR